MRIGILLSPPPFKSVKKEFAPSNNNNKKPKTQLMWNIRWMFYLLWKGGLRYEVFLGWLIQSLRDTLSFPYTIPSLCQLCLVACPPPPIPPRVTRWLCISTSHIQTPGCPEAGGETISNHTQRSVANSLGSHWPELVEYSILNQSVAKQLDFHAFSD